MPFSLLSHRNLILELTRRDIEARYRASMLGLAWTFLQPLLMLTVFTLVFAEIFQARWPGVEAGGRLDVAVVIFTGMIIHGFVAECLTRAPTLITGNPNYVKKVIFPLEVLPFVAMGSAALQALACFLILAVFILFSAASLSWTALLLPLVLLPLALLCLGLMWLLAAAGAYLRDVDQAMSFIVTLLLFLSPILYPLSALPEGLQAVVAANPLTFFIEEARAVLLWGRPPFWAGLAVATVAAALFALWARRWFERAKGGFADVI